MAVTVTPVEARRPQGTEPVRELSLEDLFAEQHQMTAVETFSKAHDAGTARPAQERYYKSLIPATAPRAGEQYAFEVDLDACSGCKACVVACHSLNGLADDESWRDVGLLHGGESETAAAALPVLQHVTSACHHCVDPGCLKGCPVNAYEKDAETGIVRHLDDQCFGCQYCTLMCPYEVPKYHAGHGIVRKCDMCSDRLANGEAPACVQSCPHEAIRIRTVSKAAVRVDAAKAEVCNKLPRGHFAIPQSPKLSQTVPTTVYKTSRLNLDALEPADLRTPQPAHAHLPLTAMLVLSQVGVGGFVAAAFIALIGLDVNSPAMMALTLVSFLIANAGLGLATLHLGRPHLAFRAVLGWRHSWLSREALAFGGFMPLAMVTTLLAWIPFVATTIGQADAVTAFPMPLSVIFTLVSIGAATSGLCAVFTSAMIYIVTQKPLWSFARTVTRFGLTTLLSAAALLAASVLLFADSESSATAKTSVIALAVFAFCKVAFDRALLVLASGDRSDQLVRSAVLLAGPLAKQMLVRTVLAACGVLLAFAALGWSPFVIPAVLLIVGGELVERWLFFTAATGRRMPGQIQPRPGVHSVKQTTGAST